MSIHDAKFAKKKAANGYGEIACIATAGLVYLVSSELGVKRLNIKQSKEAIAAHFNSIYTKGRVLTSKNTFYTQCVQSNVWFTCIVVGLCSRTL